MALEFFQIKERDTDLIEQIVKIEEDTFQGDALDIFELIAMLRHARVYVAVDYDEVLGYVYFMRNFDEPDRAFLYTINIADPKANPNLAAKLLNISMSDMKAFGIKSVEVNVDPKNYRALKIYREQLDFFAGDSMQLDLLGDEEILILQKEL